MFFIRNVHSVLPSLCSKSYHPTTSSEELRDAITFHFVKVSKTIRRSNVFRDGAGPCHPPILNKPCNRQEDDAEILCACRAGRSVRTEILPRKIQ